MQSNFTLNDLKTHGGSKGYISNCDNNNQANDFNTNIMKNDSDSKNQSLSNNELNKIIDINIVKEHYRMLLY